MRDEREVYNKEKFCLLQNTLMKMFSFVRW